MESGNQRRGPRERLREAADGLFRARGANVTLREIAHEAGTREDTAVRYYGDINGLLDPYVRGLIRQAATLWDEVGLNSPKDRQTETLVTHAGEVLRGWVKLIERECRKKRATHRELSRIEAQLSHLSRSPIIEMIQKYRMNEREIIFDLCDIGRYDDYEEVAHRIILMVYGALQEDLQYYSSARKLSKFVNEILDAHRLEPDQEECPDACDRRANGGDRGEHSGEGRV